MGFGCRCDRNDVVDFYHEESSPLRVVVNDLCNHVNHLFCLLVVGSDCDLLKFVVVVGHHVFHHHILHSFFHPFFYLHC